MIHKFKEFIVSSTIWDRFMKVNDNYLPKFGPLTVGIMGKISEFFKYKETMWTLRYLNKDWMIFTEKISSLCWFQGWSKIQICNDKNTCR